MIKYDYHISLHIVTQYHKWGVKQYVFSSLTYISLSYSYNYPDIWTP